MLSLIQASLAPLQVLRSGVSNAPSFLRWWWVISVNEAFKGRHLSLFGGATRRWPVVSHLQGTLCGETVVVVVIVWSELFEFTLFVGGLGLDSRSYWVLHWVDNSSLMVLGRKHYVILIQWHLRSHWVSHIKIREMRGIKRLLIMLLLLMRHKTHKIFRIMTQSMQRIVSERLLLYCKQSRDLCLQLPKIVSDIWDLIFEADSAAALLFGALRPGLPASPSFRLIH